MTITICQMCHCDVYGTRTLCDECRRQSRKDNERKTNNLTKQQRYEQKLEKQRERAKYRGRFKRISTQARKEQPFCTDCGETRKNLLAVDHLPGSWQRIRKGLPVKMGLHFEVVCTKCNNRREFKRIAEYGKATRYLTSEQNTVLNEYLKLFPNEKQKWY